MSDVIPLFFLIFSLQYISVRGLGDLSSDYFRGTFGGNPDNDTFGTGHRYHKKHSTSFPCQGKMIEIHTANIFPPNEIG